MTMTEAGAPARGWKAQRERGAVFWFRAMLWVARGVGRRGARVLLYPIVGYYLLTAARARAVSRQFLARALGRPPTLRDVARHLHCFASVLLDRLFVMLGRDRDYVVRTFKPEGFDTLAYARGALVFVSHLGSFEAMRFAASKNGPIKIVLDRAQTRRLTTFFQAVNPALADAIIDAGAGGPGVALAVQQALADGHRVGLMVDRAAPGEATIAAPFFGSPAPFPVGPWLLAGALKAPVVLCFCVHDGGNGYDVHFEVFSEALALPRASRDTALRDCITRYAARLEHHARLAPYNWFNFYDFWERPDARA